MSSSTLLRICVVLEWVLVGLAVGLSVLLESTLPAPLREWLTADAEGGFSLQDMKLLVVLIPILACAFVASIGLLCLQRWGACLYLIALVVDLVTLPFMGPTVEHALVSAVGQLTVLLSGLIVGLAFFSDALRARPGHAEPVPAA